MRYNIFLLLRQKTPSFLKLVMILLRFLSYEERDGVRRTRRPVRHSLDGGGSLSPRRSLWRSLGGEVGFLASKNFSAIPRILSCGGFIFVLYTAFIVAQKKDGADKLQNVILHDQMESLHYPACQYFKTHSVAQSCKEFVHNPRWRRGGFILFLLDERGTAYFFDQEYVRTWNSLGQRRDSFNMTLLEWIFQKPLISRWIEESYYFTFQLNNFVMHVHFRVIEKEGKKYAMCCGFFPASGEYIIVENVTQAAQYLSQFGAKEVFEMVNDPHGPFVRGDIYTFIFDEFGKIHAQGENLTAARGNIFSADYKYFSETNKKKLKKFVDGHTNDLLDRAFYINNAVATLYAQRVPGPNGKQYIIGSFYFPEINNDKLYSFVQQQIGQIKAAGIKEAVREFNKVTSSFIQGSLKPIVLKPDGMCLSYGTDLSYVGHNLISKKDQTGNLRFKELITGVMEKGRIWMTMLERNSYKIIYGQKVVTPEGTFIVASGYWQHSKINFVQGIVGRATDYMVRHSLEDSLLKFGTRDSDFFRGEMTVMVYDMQGICYYAGPYQKDKVWAPLETHDQQGRSVLEQVLSVATAGGGWVQYKQHNNDFHVYAQQVEAKNKAGGKESFIVMAGYYGAF